jgi:hypothetical protein
MMNIPLTAQNKADIAAIRADLKRHMGLQPIAGKAAERTLHNILKNADNLLAAIEARGDVLGPEHLGGAITPSKSDWNPLD